MILSTNLGGGHDSPEEVEAQGWKLVGGGGQIYSKQDLNFTVEAGGLSATVCSWCHSRRGAHCADSLTTEAWAGTNVDALAGCEGKI